MSDSPRKLDVIVATDCGSTTTKAILIERKGEVYRQTWRGEAPTTVEAPFEDVTRGVLNAIAELEELSGRTILDGDRIITPAEGNRGVDIYISTSSAGGGLQMIVAGVVKAMTAESAARAALGAGAIVMDSLAVNDGRLPHEKIELIRRLRPDMILLAGGTDGGTVTHVVEMAEFISAADPRPRLGAGYQLPIIYAGNNQASEQVESILGGKTALTITENLRPVLEEENLGPARHTIHDLFLEHVMQQAPGYKKLMAMTGAPIMPTPGAVGVIMETISKQRGVNLIGVDIGGATTDVFSVFQGVFNRSVSANLGMSYSVSNVLAEAGLPAILRWVPFRIGEEDLRDRIKNKMIRPTTIPQTLEELQIEQAISREALRLSLDQHRLLAVGLKGVQQQRSISDALLQAGSGDTLINMKTLDLLVGSGGVLSHAPRRSQSVAMLIDAFQPEGFTRLSVDSIFMMPHLGVLSTVHEKAATDVFDRDCMVYLGSCIAPTGPFLPPRKRRFGDLCMRYTLHRKGQAPEEHEIAFGQVRLHPLGEGEEAQVECHPERAWDMGSGQGRPVQGTMHGGVVGLVVDARGRPMAWPEDPEQRVDMVADWTQALDLYPKTAGGR